MMKESQIHSINADICPDCGAVGAFVQGPRGGLGVNTACSRCGNEFNVIYAHLEQGVTKGPAIMAFRNNAKGGPDRARLKSVFGIDLAPGDEHQERAARAYFDLSREDRECDECGERYRGPAVFCCLACAVKAAD